MERPTISNQCLKIGIYICSGWLLLSAANIIYFAFSQTKELYLLIVAGIIAGFHLILIAVCITVVFMPLMHNAIVLVYLIINLVVATINHLSLLIYAIYLIMTLYCDKSDPACTNTKYLLLRYILFLVGNYVVSVIGTYFAILLTNTQKSREPFAFHPIKQIN